MNELLSGNTSLKTIHLGKNFNKVNGENMFANANSLVTIIATKATPMTLATNVNVNGNAILYVPNLTAETAYEADISYLNVFGKNRIKPMLALIGNNPANISINRLYTDHGITVAGYKNAPSILNNIAQIYGHGYGAESARSITVEDVYQYTSYDKTTYSNSYSSTGKYGGTKSYSFASKLTYPFTVEGAKSGATSDVTINSSGTYTVPQTYYNYTISNHKKSGISDSVYSMLTANNYWLASRYCDLSSSYCNLGVRVVSSGIVYGYHVFRSTGNTYGIASLSACSVVSLKSNIRTSGQDGSGVWQLK